MRFKDHLLRRVVFFIYPHDHRKTVYTRGVDLTGDDNCITNFKNLSHFYSSGKNYFGCSRDIHRDNA